MQITITLNGQSEHNKPHEVGSGMYLNRRIESGVTLEQFARLLVYLQDKLDEIERIVRGPS